MKRFKDRVVHPGAAGLTALLLAVVVAMAVAACGSDAATPDSEATPTGTPSPSVTPVVVPSVSATTLLDAVKEGDLDAFVAAIGAAGLDVALAQDIPYTLLAPNDEAFATIGLDQLVKDVPRLEAVVDYHVIPAENLQVDELTDGQQAPTNSGHPVTFTVDGGALMVDDANVVKVIEGPTWSIFVIDKVLSPPVIVTPAASASP